MAIERITESDAFGKYSGYYIRQTDIHSVASAIVEPGGSPKVIGKLEEFHFAVYHKDAYKDSTCEGVYDDYESAYNALKEFMETEDGEKE